jgi:N-acetylglucosaminyldiphosphoundecaprenol N-acetyl-beta-D-mannosaminyltransferase
MYNLLPYLNKGILFGFGAIFNFYSGLKGQERAPEILLKYKLEWLYRLFQDPLKISKRIWLYLKIVPGLIKKEKKKLKSK